MPNAISAVGTLATSSGTGQTTLAVAPTVVGNCLVFATQIASTSQSTASVSGGGVTTWTQLGVEVATGASHTMDLWIGAITATGSSTVTVTPSGSFSGITVRLGAQEFAGGGAGTVWALDNSQSGGLDNASSTTVTFPTLTPSGANSCYVGSGWVQQTGSTTGQTSGYTVQNDSGSDPIVIYNPSVSTVQSPTTVQSPAGTSGTVGALITASTSGAAPPVYVPTVAPSLAAISRSSTW